MKLEDKMELTHFDEHGNARMVDVSKKDITSRSACAVGSILVNEEILHKIEQSDMKKGDVLGVARIAGIMGVKKTSELIPLCHPLMINKVNIDFEIDRENCLIYAYCTVKCNGKTGVEMEALTGVNICLLTIYDMCKAVSKDMEIKNVHLVSKSGGKSGDFVWKE